jgi:hypothetical protein
MGKTGYSQLSRLDSLSIRYNGAVLICDTTNTQLPDAIRIMIIKYLGQNGFNPKEFYTTKLSFQQNKDDGFVGLLGIGALRDLYNMQFSKEIRVGGAGGEGDDIVVIFDNKFKSIKRLSSSE